MFQVTLQITAGIQRKIFISCFRLRQNLHRRQWMIIIQKICRSRRKQKKIFRADNSGEGTISKSGADEMSDSLWKIGSLEGNTAEETQDTDEDSYRIESLEEDSENTEQDTQDVISVFALADGTYTADGFSFEGGHRENADHL